MSNLRVAILGAGSIGLFHAREFKDAGCEIVAILGKSQESARTKAEQLKRLYGITAKPYHDLSQLLEKEKVDAVSVCTPATLHSRQVRLCLDAGVHVLCEKPFVDDSKYENYPIARDLLRLAEQKKLILAVNTQWVYVLPYLPKNLILYNVRDFSMTMQPAIKGVSLITEAIPHMNSMLIGLVRKGKVEDIRFPILRNDYVKIKFNYNSCKVEYIFNYKLDRPREVSFSINGTKFTRKIGERYKQFLHYDGKDVQTIDLLKDSIRRFILAVSGLECITSNEDILQNIKIQDQIMKEYYKFSEAR